MRTKSLEYFLTVAEEMSFTRAAQRLFISQQALSGHVQRLEEEYGVSLFERKPSLHLTEEGKQMVFYGRQMLESERNLRRALSDISENCRSTLRVGMSRLRGTVLFPPVYEKYCAEHPNISVELISGNTGELDKMLMSGKLDVYLGLDVVPSLFEVQIPIARERVFCIMSRSLLQRHYPDSWQHIVKVFHHSVCLEDLVELPLIVQRSGTRVRTNLDHVLASMKNPRIAVECDQSEVAYLLATQGVGVALLAPIVRYIPAAGRADGDEVYAFPLADAPLETALSLVYRSDCPQARHTEEFIQEASVLLRERIAAIQSEHS